MSSNRRSAVRTATSMVGRVYTPNAPALACTIVDMSDKGAKLSFAGKVPRHRNLMVMIEPLAQVRSAVVRWRRAETVGVEFVRGVADLPAA